MNSKVSASHYHCERMVYVSTTVIEIAKHTYRCIRTICYRPNPKWARLMRELALESYTPTIFLICIWGITRIAQATLNNADHTTTTAHSLLTHLLISTRLSHYLPIYNTQPLTTTDLTCSISHDRRLPSH